MRTWNVVALSPTFVITAERFTGLPEYAGPALMETARSGPRGVAAKAWVSALFVSTVSRTALSGSTTTWTLCWPAATFANVRTKGLLGPVPRKPIVRGGSARTRFLNVFTRTLVAPPVPWFRMVIVAVTFQPSRGVVVLNVMDSTIRSDRKSTRLNSSHGYISYC